MLAQVSRICHPSGMGKKRGILLAILLVALAGGVGWLLLRPREPVYQAKPLSAWLEQYYGSNLTLITDTNSPARLEAENAIRQIGTGGLPLLLRLISTRDS